MAGFRGRAAGSGSVAVSVAIGHPPARRLAAAGQRYDAAAIEGEGRRDRDDDETRRRDEDPDHDPGGLTGRPGLERLDDEPVPQRTVA